MSDNLGGGNDFALSLYKLRVIPPYVVREYFLPTSLDLQTGVNKCSEWHTVAALVWVIHDYCESASSLKFLLLNIADTVITLEDEAR